MNTPRIYLVAFVLSTGIALYAPAVNAQVSVSLSVFQNDLGPYGRWINSPRYGQVWTYSEPGFRPYYSNGHWEYSDYGWAWVSDYDWGWAPFHYGRWEEDPYYGWIWIPGYEWAPAWVSWSEYDGNYGWAPLGFGLSVNVSFGAIPFNRWTFVPRQNICSPNLHNYYINAGRNHGFRNAVVINNVYVNNNTRFFAGPRRGDVERYTRNSIPVRHIDYGRPDRLAGNSNNNRGRNDHFNGPARIDRSGQSRMPGRADHSRSADNFPGRADNAERPSGNFSGRANNDRPSNNLHGRTGSPERSSGRPERTEMGERPSRTFPGGNRNEERPSAGRSVERAERPSFERRGNIQQRSGSTGMQRSSETRQHVESRQQRERNSHQSGRGGNGSRSGRRG